MQTVYNICCGIDVHKKLIVTCLVKQKHKEIREYKTTTKSLLELADWLTSSGCEMVAMESTGSYWKPLYNILETNDLATIVVNARHMHAVPGRKTDVQDAEWIADLLQHGLLRASYIPNKAQRELRELVSYRKSLVGEKARELNRLQTILEGAKIKLSGTVRDINGKSARSLLSAIMANEVVDEIILDKMRSNHQIAHNLKATDEQLVDDLNGFLTPLQKRILNEILIHIDELCQHIKNLDDEIDNNMSRDEQIMAKRVSTIPGIAETSSKAIIAVIGTDMSRFPTAHHLSSWAGLCPGNNESAGKRHSGKTRQGNSLLKTTLIVCAHSAVRNKNSFFYAQYKRISSRRGAKRAFVAVAHSMLIAIYYMLKEDKVFKDLGADYYHKFNKEHKINSYLKKLRELGWEPQVLEPTIAPIAM